jgi:cell division transport system permease protein
MRLYVVAVSSLTVAFLCLAGTLLAMTNLDIVAEQWGRSGRMTIYLRDGARETDVEQMRVVLEALPEVTAVEHVTAAEAREQFVRDAEVGGDLAGLPPDVFPASLEVTLTGGLTPERVEAIAGRVTRFRSVEDVETYRGWYEQLGTLVATGRAAAVALALLVLICVVAVVGNTIRLAVAGRRIEIEVMKLCGATDTFVRRPFVIEGAMQGFSAAFLAVVLLLITFFALSGPVDRTLAALTGVTAEFLHPLTVLAMVLGGALLGALGSALSLRRYLTV